MTGFERTVGLPYGYRVTFRHGQGLHIGVEWEPDTPNIRSARHRRKFNAAYLAARDDFLRDVAIMIRGRIAVSDLAGNLTVIEPPAAH